MKILLVLNFFSQFRAAILSNYFEFNFLTIPWTQTGQSLGSFNALRFDWNSPSLSFVREPTSKEALYSLWLNSTSE